jgi:hypothetical protein
MLPILQISKLFDETMKLYKSYHFLMGKLLVHIFMYSSYKLFMLIAKITKYIVSFIFAPVNRRKIINVLRN